MRRARAVFGIIVDLGYVERRKTGGSVECHLIVFANDLVVRSFTTNAGNEVGFITMINITTQRR